MAPPAGLQGPGDWALLRGFKSKPPATFEGCRGLFGGRRNMSRTWSTAPFGALIRALPERISEDAHPCQGVTPFRGFLV